MIKLSNKKKFLIIILLLVAVVGFSLSAVSASNGYSHYKDSFKLYKDSYTYMGNKYPYPYKKERISGGKGKYGGSAEIYLYKKGKKVTKKSYLRISDYYGNGNFKVSVKFRYWNGYKYINKYKTKTYYKKTNLAYANGGISSTNWIPVSVKIYTK
ncbi:hypothetical protein SDC9_21214 [bioreactor metagenome]|uniref:Uncharacterized protein n=1 Tax=bioreactor metagenome TaxID=1076179 RepID=A0A644U8Y7_9ZZZZ